MGDTAYVQIDRAKPPTRKARDIVNELYHQLKDIVVLYRIRPGERINELELAERFQISRTPLREALNRLAAENLLSFVPNHGFFVRQLDLQEIFDLYELRAAIECAAVRQAVLRASDEAIAELAAFWKGVEEQPGEAPDSALLGLDEAFHLRVARLSGNAEIVRSLETLNARIRFVRWIDVEGKKKSIYQEHNRIIAALRERDAMAAEQLMAEHVGRRIEDVTRIVREGVIRLYVP